jgi:hypothetical protein
MQFNPLLYSYQLALAQAQAQAAQASQASKGSGKSSPSPKTMDSGNKMKNFSGKNASMSEIQRAMDLQRQYLLEMMPQNSVPNSRHNNWKSN